MSWAALLALAAGCYALKAVGPLLVGDRRPPEPLNAGIQLLAVPLLAALIAVQTLGDGRRLEIDARVAALIVAGLLVWRKAPLLVVVLAAGATAALLRAL
jgi:branched-subunit amino acid transport protein